MAIEEERKRVDKYLQPLKVKKLFQEEKVQENSNKERKILLVGYLAYKASLLRQVLASVQGEE
jgi:hypothetical protein